MGQRAKATGQGPKPRVKGQSQGLIDSLAGDISRMGVSRWAWFDGLGVFGKGMIDDGYQLASFLRSFLLGLEEDELLEEELERRFLDLLLCFFTFLRYPQSTFSSSR
jgi:hypothetical protein